MKNLARATMLPMTSKMLRGVPLLLLVMTVQQAVSQTAVASLKNQISSHTSGVAVWWVGHNGWLIKSDDFLIATDLVLDETNLIQPASISASELASEIDVAFVTHWHGDHFHRETSRVLARESNCLFVMPANCVPIATEIGIPKDRIRVAIPGKAMVIGEASVQPLRAIHGNRRFAVYQKANLEDCGYHIKLGGKTFLQPGDSVLLEDHLFLKHVDVLFFSPTEHNTHIDRSVILINELDPDYILPQHRDTYKVTNENRFWTHGYAPEVKLLLSPELQQRYYILEHGQQLRIE